MCNQDIRDSELEELKEEIRIFKIEKDRIKRIVGQIGGVPTFNSKIFNFIFGFFIVACLVLSLLNEGLMQLAMIEVAVAVVSLKMIYLIHNQGKVNHFQLWILTSLEWRINELIKQVKEIDSKMEEKK